MVDGIDNELEQAFLPELIMHAYYQYKHGKWDHLSGMVRPKIFVPLGADGVTYESFEKQIGRHTRNISRRIYLDSYIFYPFREVDKKKDVANPSWVNNTRTLGIASIRDALVQTILYKDVLYEPTEAVFRKLDQFGPVSFAYRKGLSAPLAAKLVHKYSQEGYCYVYDADLSKFFDSISHDILLKLIANLLGGSTSRTYKLVRRFIRTDRTPYKTYSHSKLKPVYKIFHNKKPLRLSPKQDKGVPQGGMLSGMLANLYLHPFDEWVVKSLGVEEDLKYVRYADDFIIMVKSKDALHRIKDQVCERLESLTFKLEVNRTKTKLVEIKEGLDFIGFNFDGVSMRVRQKTIEKFKNRFKEEIFDAVPDYIKQQKSLFETIKWLNHRINSKIQGVRSAEKCPWCQYERVGPPRSWITFFQSTTDIAQLRRLDKWIRQCIYQHIYTNFNLRTERGWLKIGKGLKSLVNEMYDVRRAKQRPCLCDIKLNNHDIWKFAVDLYQGRTFETLALKRIFTVPFVYKDRLQVSVGKRQYFIKREVLQELWERLTKGEQISRVSLEKVGTSNTSHVVTLLAQLPGIQISLNPILLIFKENQPASFLTMPHAVP